MVEASTRLPFHPLPHACPLPLWIHGVIRRRRGTCGPHPGVGQQSGTLCLDMGTRAREAFEAHWDKDQALARWEEVLMAAKTMK